MALNLTQPPADNEGACQTISTCVFGCSEVCETAWIPYIFGTTQHINNEITPRTYSLIYWIKTDTPSGSRALASSSGIGCGLIKILNPLVPGVFGAKVSVRSGVNWQLAPEPKTDLTLCCLTAWAPGGRRSEANMAYRTREIPIWSSPGMFY
uniref:Uncharacterized protein n=1 Tax=Romanomermis culicivorax TaxID=13658 RepID=A0A915I8A4_ROMCU